MRHFFFALGVGWVVNASWREGQERRTWGGRVATSGESSFSGRQRGLWEGGAPAHRRKRWGLAMEVEVLCSLPNPNKAASRPGKSGRFWNPFSPAELRGGRGREAPQRLTGALTVPPRLKRSAGRNRAPQSARGKPRGPGAPRVQPMYPLHLPGACSGLSWALLAGSAKVANSGDGANPLGWARSFLGLCCSFASPTPPLSFSASPVPGSIPVSRKTAGSRLGVQIR